jgi:hypothetical protein
MGVFPNENASARPFWDTHQREKCSNQAAPSLRPQRLDRVHT